MLVLTVSDSDVVQIGDVQIVVTDTHRGRQFRLCIDAPKSQYIIRNVLDPKAPATDAQRNRAIALLARR